MTTPTIDSRTPRQWPQNRQWNPCCRVRWFADRSQADPSHGRRRRWMVSSSPLIGSADAFLTFSFCADEPRVFLQQLWTHPASAEDVLCCSPSVLCQEQSRGVPPSPLPRSILGHVDACRCYLPPALQHWNRREARHGSSHWRIQHSQPRALLRAYPPRRSPSPQSISRQ